MSIRQNLVTGLGETFNLNLEYSDENNTPIDLSGHSISLTVRKGTVVVGTYPAAVDAEGNVEIKVTDEVTDTWPVGKLNYLVIHTTPSGDEKWLLYGALTVMDGVAV